MTIPTQFAHWLSVAQRDGEGGTSAEPPAIVRGRTRAMTLNLPTSATHGDWTGGVFAATLRASPGASVVATYSATTGTPAGGLTPVTLVLEPANQSGIPATDINEKVIELFLDVAYTPSGGSADTIISTRQLVRE